MEPVKHASAVYVFIHPGIFKENKHGLKCNFPWFPFGTISLKKKLELYQPFITLYVPGS